MIAYSWISFPIIGFWLIKTSITTRNSNTDEASAWMIKYFKEASVVKIFSCEDISGIKDIRLISNPIQAPSQELDEIEIKIPPIKVVDRRILVGLLGTREESYTLCMGYEPISLP